MKVYNLTDVPTDLLEVRQLVGCPVKVGNTVVMPGTWAEIPDRADALSDVNRYRVIGVLAVDVLPEQYVKAKQAITPKSHGLDVIRERLRESAESTRLFTPDIPFPPPVRREDEGTTKPEASVTERPATRSRRG